MEKILLDVHSGQVVVLFEEEIPADLEVIAHAKITASGQRLRFATLQTASEDVRRLLGDLRARADVVSAEPETWGTLHATPNDLFYPLQWGPAAIGLPQTWDAGFGSHAVKVAVLDTGIDYTHEDLGPNTFLSDLACGPDRNVFGGVLPPEYALDDNGHGSHVAGIVAAATQNTFGVAGTSQSCLMSIKVCNLDSQCSGTALALGIEHAVVHGADVLTMSLGIVPSLLVQQAIEDAWASGVLLVASADNAGCGGETLSYPARLPEVIAVGALAQPGDARAGFSSCGSDLELMAPGEEVFSTLASPLVDKAVWVAGTAPNLPTYLEGLIEDLGECIEIGQCEIPDPPQPPFNFETRKTRYGFMSGTSMAAPHVAGVAGLLLAANPDLTNVQLRCLLTTTATDLGLPGRDVEYGFGRLDAATAVAAAADPGSAGC